GFLGQVARAFTTLDAERVAFLTADDGKGASLVVAGGGDAVDIRALGTAAAARLDGRGGGPKGLFQGKVGSLDRRSEALSTLIQAVAGASAGSADADR
ncbi:MAG: hypothetical protein AAGM22_06465, partial [Acidobacteriota bacterium]